MVNFSFYCKKYFEVTLFFLFFSFWFFTILLGNNDFFSFLSRLNESKKCGFGFRYDYASASSLWVSFIGFILCFVFYFRHRSGWIKTIGFYERSRGKLGYFFGSSCIFTILFAYNIISQWLGACYVGKLGIGLVDQLHSVLVVLAFVCFLFSLLLVLLAMSERLNEMESSDNE